MKKVFKNPLFTFILGVVIAASFSVYATVSILSSQVDYNPRDNTWDVNNVEDAINELYQMAATNGGNNNGFVGYSFEFGYTGSVQRFEVPATGEYKIELWGSQASGNGAYTAGTASFDYGTELFLYIGSTNSTFNGGGPYASSATDGAGATDIRFFGLYTPSDEDLAWNSTTGLNSRVMVAAGGGGLDQWSSGYPGGAGGGLTGYNGSGDHSPVGGNQTSGGTTFGGDYNGTFGKGGRGEGWGGGGGAGYYGGSGGRNSSTGNGGAGGSSYISGHAGCVAIKEGSTTEPREIKTEGCTQGTTDVECSKHYSGLYFTDTIMVDGQGYSWTNVKGSQTGMPSYSSTTTINGNNAVGHAKITYLG